MLPYYQLNTLLYSCIEIIYISLKKYRFSGTPEITGAHRNCTSGFKNETRKIKENGYSLSSVPVLLQAPGCFRVVD
jgi:hypothetical protein